MENLSRKEKAKTGIKIILCSVGIVAVFFFILCAFYLVIPSVGISFLIAMIVSGLLLMGIVSYLFPTMFKDYIDYYWEHHKEDGGEKNGKEI